MSSSDKQYYIPTSKPWSYQAITCRVCCALKMVWSVLACGLADKLLRLCDTGMVLTLTMLANTNRSRHVLTRRERSLGKHQHQYR
jgi:hypothetical protein